MLENQYPYPIPLDIFIWVAICVYIIMTFYQAYRMHKDVFENDLGIVFAGTIINLVTAFFWPVALFLLLLSLPVFVIYKIIGKVKGEV